MSTPQDDEPILITEAAVPADVERHSREKRYFILMSLRIPCIIGGVLLYQIPWLALLVIAMSIPLPWIAVLIANNGPIRKREHPSRYRTPPITQKRIDPGHTIINDRDS